MGRRVNDLEELADETAVAAATRRALNRIALPNGGGGAHQAPELRSPSDVPSRPSSLYATPLEMSRENSRTLHDLSSAPGPPPVSSASTRYAPSTPTPHNHQAYTLGAPTLSTSGRSSTSSLLPRSPSQTSFASMSPPPPSMERSRSSGSTESHHGRNQSLTSAYAPATSITLGTPGGSRSSEVDPFSPRLPTADGRTTLVRPYDWNYEAEKPHDDDDDVRQGAKRRPSAQIGLVGRVLDAPPNLLGYLTRSLRTKPPSSRSLTSNALNGSPLKGADSKRRAPLVIRLAFISYLAFSFLYLTCSLPRHLFGGSDPASLKDQDGTFAALRARLASASSGEPGESWRNLAGDLGAKAGIDLPWNRGAAVDSVDAPMPVSAMEAEDAPGVASDSWGKVQRIGNPDGACLPSRSTAPPADTAPDVQRNGRRHEIRTTIRSLPSRILTASQRCTTRSIGTSLTKSYRTSCRPASVPRQRI